LWGGGCHGGLDGDGVWFLLFEMGEEGGEGDVGADAAVEFLHYCFGAGFDAGVYGYVRVRVGGWGG